MNQGDTVRFSPTKGAPRLGELVSLGLIHEPKGFRPHQSLVLLTGDPYPVWLKNEQLQVVGSKKPKEGEMVKFECPTCGRVQEALAGAEVVCYGPKPGVSHTGNKQGVVMAVRAPDASQKPAEKEAPVAKAKGKSSTKEKAPKAAAATKASASTATNGKSKPKGDGTNPYREGSSMAFIFDELVKGGKVEAIATRVVSKFPPKVRADVEDADAQALSEACYRVGDVLRTAERAGLSTSKDGKGRTAVAKIG